MTDNTLTLREEIEAALSAYASNKNKARTHTQLDGAKVVFAHAAERLLRRVLSEGLADDRPTPATASPFKVGDRVKDKRTGKYLGEISSVTPAYSVHQGDTYAGDWSEDSLELAPNLTPDTVWPEVLSLLLRETKNATGYQYNSLPFNLPEAKAIRSHCYRLLGSSGVKVTDEVQYRVQALFRQVAEALNVEV